MLQPIQPSPSTSASRPAAHADMVATARAFEAMVISQMLQASGLDKPPADFGGGTGEAQFASFLTDAQAQSFAARGGIGLAERLIRAMAAGGQNR